MVSGEDDRNALGYPAENGTNRCRRRNFRLPLAAFEVGPSGFNDDGANGIGQHPLNLTVESFTMLPDAPKEVRQTFPLYRDDAFQPLDAVVPSGQSACYGSQRGQVERQLLAGVDDRRHLLGLQL